MPDQSMKRPDLAVMLGIPVTRQGFGASCLFVIISWSLSKPSGQGSCGNSASALKITIPWNLAGRDCCNTAIKESTYNAGYNS